MDASPNHRAQKAARRPGRRVRGPLVGLETTVGTLAEAARSMSRAGRLVEEAAESLDDAGWAGSARVARKRAQVLWDHAETIKEASALEPAVSDS